MIEINSETRSIEQHFSLHFTLIDRSMDEKLKKKRRLHRNSRAHVIACKADFLLSHSLLFVFFTYFPIEIFRVYRKTPVIRNTTNNESIIKDAMHKNVLKHIHLFGKFLPSLFSRSMTEMCWENKIKWGSTMELNHFQIGPLTFSYAPASIIFQAKKTKKKKENT